MRRGVRRASRAGRRQRSPWRWASAVACCLLVGTVILGAQRPRVAVTVPGLALLLNKVAPLLPGRVAWMHDYGSARLRSGAYLGWSDGRTGQLYLYGSGCEGPANADTLTNLTLRGPGGTLEVPPQDVEHLSSNLDRARPHSYLSVQVVTDGTMEFDRASLKCRSGTEASARVAVTVLYAPKIVAEGAPEGETLPLGSLGSFPGAGLIAEIALAAGEEPFTLRSVRYAPTAAATGVLHAVAGPAAGAPFWRQQARSGPPPPEISNPWDTYYQSRHDPRSYGPRAADALDLTLNPSESGLVVIGSKSFKATPYPRPLLLLPLVEHGTEAATRLLVMDLAFGWTPRP